MDWKGVRVLWGILDTIFARQVQEPVKQIMAWTEHL